MSEIPDEFGRRQKQIPREKIKALRDALLYLVVERHDVSLVDKLRPTSNLRFDSTRVLRKTGQFRDIYTDV